jgi:hypothetical protein
MIGVNKLRLHLFTLSNCEFLRELGRVVSLKGNFLLYQGTQNTFLLLGSFLILKAALYFLTLYSAPRSS